jgi:DNA (cytosine-5)-methyltransferase 1
MSVNVIDLFAGAGGLSLGLEQAGLQVMLAVDSWQLAVDTYTKNFTHPATCADISALSGHELLDMAAVVPGELDLIVGGPPCQGFSVQRIGQDLDQRNLLVLDFARILIEARPRAFLMENVLGLLGSRGKPIAAELASRLHAAGYTGVMRRVNGVDYGVPQNRRRVLIAGSRSGEPPVELRDPMPQRVVTVWDAIGDLAPPAAPGTVSAADPLHVESRLSPLNRKRLALIPPGGGFEDLPPHMRVQAHSAGASAIGHRGVYGRLAPDRPAGTITARFDSFTRGRFAHPYHNRNITLREGARLQTFPDDFFFLGNREEIAAQIGNAVPPRLAHAIGIQLAEQLQAARG